MEGGGQGCPQQCRVKGRAVPNSGGWRAGLSPAVEGGGQGCPQQWRVEGRAVPSNGGWRAGLSPAMEGGGQGCPQQCPALWPHFVAALNVRTPKYWPRLHPGVPSIPIQEEGGGLIQH